MQHKKFSRFGSSDQTGATLIVALMLLVVILLTGLAAMNNSGSQFKLAANSQYESQALNKAETAIATAEDWLSTGSNFSTTGFATYTATTPHLHPIDRIASLVAPNNNYLTMDWSDGNSLVVGGDANQRYMIELLSKDNRLQGSNQGITGRAVTGCNKVNIFLITARGQAARNAIKVVQSIYSVKSC